jgi:hypothetical protein
MVYILVNFIYFMNQHITSEVIKNEYNLYNGRRREEDGD